MALQIDKHLAANLKRARSGHPMQFAFFPRGGSGKLLVEKKLSPMIIEDARDAAGGTSPTRGRCVGEGGILHFEVAKAPSSLEPRLRRCLKETAGLTFPIVVRAKAGTPK